MFPPGVRWQTILESHTDVAAYGAVITPAQNNLAVATYATVMAGAAVTQDAFGIWICINANNAAAAARDTLVTLGIDLAGGSSFTDFAVALAASSAAAFNSSTIFGGHFYYFPVRIPAGASIGAKASVNNGTVATLRVAVKLYCNPDKPERVVAGTAIATFGATLASSSGTALTAGATYVEGVYVQLGSAIADDTWFWQLGVCITNAAMNNNGAVFDLAIGSPGSEAIVIPNRYVQTNAAEIVSFNGAEGQGFFPGTAGAFVYARATSPAAAIAGWSALAYGVTGRYTIPTSASFTVAGTVTIDGAAPANGKTVQVYAVDAEGIAELYATTTTAGGAGGFTVDVVDGTRTYFASYENDARVGRSLGGTPEVSTFDITIGGSASGLSFPNLASSTTRGAIRDRIVAVIEATVPSRLPNDRFRNHRDDADFDDYIATHPGAARRLFEVRDDGRAETPRISNYDIHELEARFLIRIAYPKTGRDGARWGKDRDDAAELDVLAIDYAIGITGRQNFTVTDGADAIPMGVVTRREIDRVNDVLELEATFIYQVQVSDFA